MCVEKFVVSRDDGIYEAFPDVALMPSGKLICVFLECAHHTDRSYTRIMLSSSTDRGRSWTPKLSFSEPIQDGYAWNCPRITLLPDGRVVVLADHGPSRGKDKQCLFNNYLWFSHDEGKTWDGPHITPALGIVPDRLLELPSGRWIISCHYSNPISGFVEQRLWYSDNQGAAWQGPVTVAAQKGLNLCEVSILSLPNGVLVSFLRENSGEGKDCYKAISHDEGKHWDGVYKFPLPGCHRPVAGILRSGRILITYRFMQGGRPGFGYWTQNFFAALTDEKSAQTKKRDEAWTRIMPIDFDRSPVSDLGYSGWVQFPDGEIYIVNYIVDEAPGMGYIRGYSLAESDFVIGEG